MHPRQLAGLAIGLLGAQAAWAEGFVPYDNPKAIEIGQDLYADNCASCHGVALEGEPNWRSRDEDGYLPAPPHDETGHTWHHPDRQLFLTTKYGTEAMVGQGYKSRMLGFQEVLSDQEIAVVLAYIKSTWPKRVIDTHNRINAGSDQ
ncbi:cytochrome c [Thalassovita sp.]|uniref:c-type cytochrome n=1 Tax=Thalassovita sp. TaxID=1979401 RepID=UPI002881735B|nr:cytochrome c [Thalassovita sp.]MDF1803803.1 cytochrome c [Thalassovita sp.]